MSDINKLNSFKNITLKDNIFVKEGNGYKKSNFAEIGDTLIKYIDIDEIINEVISRRDDFLEVFKQRGIYPIIRMSCNVIISDLENKKVSLVQKPLSINGQNRYKDIPEDYISKGILEVFIEKLPEEVSNFERKFWQVVSIDTPILSYFKKEKTEAEGSDIMLSDFILTKPTRFSYTTFNSLPCWILIKDTFPGSVEAYASPTGIDGYIDYGSISDVNSYLRFINSSKDPISLDEDISRTKLVNLQGNNVMIEKYVEEDISATPQNVLYGKDIELTSSTATEGSGSDSVGVKLIRKDQTLDQDDFRPGRHEVGTVIFSLNKTKFGVDEYEKGILYFSSLTNTKIYDSSLYSVFVEKFNITTPTFVIRDICFRKDNPFNLDDSFFENYRVGFTTHEDEMGLVVNGKLSAGWAITENSTYPSSWQYFGHRINKDIMHNDKRPGISVEYLIPDSSGVSVIDGSTFDSKFSFVPSTYKEKNNALEFRASLIPNPLQSSNGIKEKNVLGLHFICIGIKDIQN